MSALCLQVYTYYGSERNRSVAFLSQQDVVLTTYNVLSTELEAKNGIMKVRANRVAVINDAALINQADMHVVHDRKSCHHVNLRERSTRRSS
jgi:hypothetical protein